MSTSGKHPSFLTDDSDNPGQTLENINRFLCLLMFMDHSQPLNDYAHAAVTMILGEISDALTELGDNYTFMKKDTGGAT